MELYHAFIYLLTKAFDQMQQEFWENLLCAGLYETKDSIVQTFKNFVNAIIL